MPINTVFDKTSSLPLYSSEKILVVKRQIKITVPLLTSRWTELITQNFASNLCAA
jgi:hypothetical protein